MAESVTEEVLKAIPDGPKTVYYCDGCGVMLSKKTVFEDKTCTSCGSELEVPEE